MWDYAKLSSAAKDFGGPDKFIDTIESASKELGRAQGHKDMVPVVGLFTVAGMLITGSIVQVINNKKIKKAKIQGDINEAKEIVKEGIRKYDSEHQTSTESVDKSQNNKEETH